MTRNKYRLAMAAVLAALCGILTAATLPTAAPVHSGLSSAQLQGYSADYLQQIATGSSVATLPASGPAHAGLSSAQLQGFSADYLQDILNGTAKVFNVGTYGAYPDDGLDDKAGIQAAIDAAIADVGGIVQLAAGTYNVAPLGTGIGLLTDGDFVCLRGQGESTEIVFTGSTATTPWVGIAPKRYTTTTTPYGAAPLWIEDLRLTSDEYASTNGHDLFAFAHCPWGIARHIGCEQIMFHAFEINLSKNIVVEDCYIYGTGNIGRVDIELDPGGSCGLIASGGALAQTTPLENIVIRRFVRRVPRADLTITTAGYDNLLLSHSNANLVLRNVVVEGCVFWPHNNTTLASGTNSTSVGWDTAALPLRVDGLYIRNNTFVEAGGLSGSHILIDLSCPSTATRNLRNIHVTGNVILSPHAVAIRAGSFASSTAPLTAVTDAIVRSHDQINIADNAITVLHNGNGNSARATRSIVVGAARSVRIVNNNIHWPDAANGAGWGTSTVSAGCGVFVDHVQNLVMENNTVEITRPQTGGTAGMWCQVYAYVFGCAAYEIQTTLSGHWIVRNNKAVGNGNIGVNLACGFLGLYTSGTTGLPQWNAANKLTPRITGLWTGNSALQTGTGTYTHTLQSTYPRYFVTAGSVTNTALDEAALAALGAHDWTPGAESIGTVTTVPAGTTLQTGWKLYDGTASTALPWLQECAWNQKLGLSGTANLPTTANTYIRLSGQ